MSEPLIVRHGPYREPAPIPPPKKSPRRKVTFWEYAGVLNIGAAVAQFVIHAGKGQWGWSVLWGFFGILWLFLFVLDNRRAHRAWKVKLAALSRDDDDVAQLDEGLRILTLNQPDRKYGRVPRA